MLSSKAMKISELRVSHGWTKVELAKKAGIQHSSIVRAEQGLGVSPKSAKAIADALEKPVLEIFEIVEKGA